MRPLLIQSLPNSGSSWFADLVARSGRDIFYRMEFFNPIRNIRHFDALSAEFGCELTSCYRNIINPPSPSFGDVIANTWGRESFNMTKEVFAPYKTAGFVEHFDVVIFIRTYRESFPPSRLRVWSWYEHIWSALRENGALLKARSLEGKAIEAHRILQQRLLADAERLGLPVLWYEDLYQKKDGLQTMLEPVFGERAVAIADLVDESRRTIGRVSSDF